MQSRIIVTGGSKGIGKAITQKLLAGGYAVHMCARSETELMASAEQLQHLGNLSYSVLDLSDPQDIVRFTRSWNLPLYGLINNAGICETGRLDDSHDVWERVIATNLTGPYLLTRGLFSHLVSGGRIVNIASQLGKEGRAGYGAYSASKFGLIGLTKCWAKELGPQEITVNAVCPGWVKTDMAMKDMERLAAEKGVSTEEYYKEICAPLELKRFTTPEEVANLVVFLVSEEASGITGRDWLLNTIWNQE